jgi:hypothetical protein
MRRGTRTARAGAVTSATNVVDERALMQAGTVSGLAMHFTSTGMWGVRSGLASVAHRDVAHFTAATETYAESGTNYYEYSSKSAYLLFGVVHGPLDFRQYGDQFGGYCVFGGGYE